MEDNKQNKNQDNIIQEKNLSWDEFFNLITIPIFGGNCFVLLKMENCKVTVQSIGANLDSMKFLITATKQQEDKPDYIS